MLKNITFTYNKGNNAVACVNTAINRYDVRIGLRNLFLNEEMISQEGFVGQMYLRMTLHWECPSNGRSISLHRAGD